MAARRPPWASLAFAALLLLVSGSAAAQGLDLLTVTTDPDGEQTWSISLQVLLIMTALTFLPAALMMMTAFTRIIIVLAILRQAVGLMSAPTNQVLVGMALFLTFFIMAPVFDRMYQQGIEPYFNEEVNLMQGAELAGEPLREFMLAQTREKDLAFFAGLGDFPDLNGPEDVPYSLLIPAFVASELKTAFQIGFLLFIPFLIIDLVVASVLMSMGMMMLSPMIISLPFKVMLFVLVDGWTLVMGTLASSFYI